MPQIGIIEKSKTQVFISKNSLKEKKIENEFNIYQYYKSKAGSSSFFYGFPMSYFIAFLSYSFILYLEKVAFSTDEKKSQKDIKLADKKEYKLDDEIIEPLLKEENDKEKNDDNVNINEFQELQYNNKENENKKINSTIMSKMNKGKYIYNHI